MTGISEQVDGAMPAERLRSGQHQRGLVAGHDLLIKNGVQELISRPGEGWTDGWNDYIRAPFQRAMGEKLFVTLLNQAQRYKTKNQLLSLGDKARLQRGADW